MRKRQESLRSTESLCQKLAVPQCVCLLAYLLTSTFKLAAPNISLSWCYQRQMRVGSRSYCTYEEKKVYGTCHKSIGKKVSLVLLLTEQFGCLVAFFIFLKNNVIFSVCFFVFWLIYSGLKGVRKVKESRRIFFTSFLPLLSPDRSLIL